MSGFFKKLFSREKVVDRVRHEFYREGVLGTSFEFKAWGCSRDLAEQAEAAAFEEADRLEQIFSIYRPDSELNRFFQAGDWIDVSPELAAVLAEAEKWRVLTEGAFNPAAQSILEHLRHSDSPIELSSDPLWEVDQRNLRARKVTPYTCSLNAMAKGWIIDQAAKKASETGVDDLLVNIGGDLRFWGSYEHTAAVADPLHDAENDAPASVVTLQNEGMAVSGGYRRGFERDGLRISHLMDPIKGQEAVKILTAAVVAPSAMIADVVATAATVFEPERSLEFATEHSARCLIIDAEGKYFKS